MKTPRCSIIITAYNSFADLPPCLDNLLKQKYPDYEVILVDNASTDNTPQIGKKYSPFVHYVRLPENRAIAGGYNAGAQAATGEILIFINADTVPQPGWLSALVQPIIENPRIGMTTSRILLHNAPHLVNTCGNDVTWTGLTVCRGLGEPANQWQESSRIAAASGASCAIRRALFEAIGGFDETLEFYLDDTELSLRAQLAGYEVWYSPASLILHRYSFQFSSHKAFYQERNRWLTMLKILRPQTLLLLLPGLIFGEVLAWAYTAMKGREHVRAKLASWQWLWSNREKVRQLRRQTQALRQVPDREILRLWSPKLRFTGTVSPAVSSVLNQIVQPILRGYGAVCRLLAIW